MARTIRFHPEALEDAERAAAWYAERSARAAIRFLDELDRVVNRIATSPLSFPTGEGGVRRAMFRRYPFYAAFTETAGAVTVLAIAHGKRKPSYWRDRRI